MDLTLPMVMPWLLTGATLAYTVWKNSKDRAVAQELRLRNVEVAQLTDRLNTEHELKILNSQITAAQAQIQESRNLITRALNAN